MAGTIANAEMQKRKPFMKKLKKKKMEERKGRKKPQAVPGAD